MLINLSQARLDQFEPVANLQHESRVENVLTRGAQVNLARRFFIAAANRGSELADEGNSEIAGVPRSEAGRRPRAERSFRRS